MDDVAAAVKTRRHRGRAGANHALALELAAGRTVRQAARSVGLSESTVFRRLADPEFRALVDRFRDRAAERALDRMAERAAGAAQPK